LSFSLNSRLENDTWLLGESDINLLLLMNDKRYPWCILVPKREAVTEIHHLDDLDQGTVWKECCVLSRVMSDVFSAQKMNIGALGNIVSQLHIHHIARFETDPAWPGPVWGHSSGVAYGQLEVNSLSSRLFRTELGSIFKKT